jgi:hypothetical protein
MSDVRTAAEPMTAALTAPGPNPAHGGALDLYGRLVGVWDVTNRYLVEDPPGSGTGEWRTGTVVWSFGWILAGNGVQDVMWFASDDPQPRRATGSTVRLYDPAAQVWHVVWFSPAGTTTALTGRPGPDGGIVQDGVDGDGRPIRWTFTDLTDSAFRWWGEVSDDGGATWRLEQEMRGRRR